MNYRVDSKGRECSGCGEYKIWDSFHKDKGSPTKHISRCKDCSKSRGNNNRVATPSDVKQNIDNLKCSVCSKIKPASEFRKRRKDFGGGIYSICDFCVKNPLPIPSAITSADLDLGFLLDMKRLSKIGWTIEQAKLLLFKIKEAHEAGSTNFDQVYMKYSSGKSKSGCIAILKELKTLAKHNQDTKKLMTLEEYWKAGRPFKSGAKVLVKGKK